MDALTDLALRAGTGDRLALAELVQRTQPEVWRLCARLADRDAADELAQEVYLRAIPALERFRADASARTWLLRIARNVCADHLRRKRRRALLVDRLVHRRALPDEVAAPRTGEVELDEAIAALSTDRREAFVLTQVAGLPYAEAAEVCGVPVGTIRSRVARARRDLLDHLTADADAVEGLGASS